MGWCSFCRGLYRTSFTVPGTPPGKPAISPTRTEDVRAAAQDGVRVELTGNAVIGQRSDLGLRFTDAATGTPVTGIQPYLGAAGHVVILRADGTRFAHAHAETTDSRGRPKFATPGSTFGPDLDLHTTFGTAGTYQLWGQFRLPDGQIITTAFTVHPHSSDHEETR